MIEIRNIVPIKDGSNWRNSFDLILEGRHAAKVIISAGELEYQYVKGGKFMLNSTANKLGFIVAMRTGETVEDPKAFFNNILANVLWPYEAIRQNNLGHLMGHVNELSIANDYLQNMPAEKAFDNVRPATTDEQVSVARIYPTGRNGISSDGHTGRSKGL